MKKTSGFVCTRGLLVLIFFLLSISLPLHAQWTQSGLDGYYIRTITVSGSNVFAGTSGDGMFRSTNSGLSWSPANSGLVGLEFPAFAISGSNLYAGSEGEGVFLSTNNGVSWTALSPLTNQFVFALAVSGTDLYAGVDGGGVFRSTNNGASWSNSTSGMTNTRVTSLAISGFNLFAGTFGGGVFLSTNNGTTWTAVNNGLSNTDVQTVIINPVLPGYIFAGTANGAYYTTNSGSSWNAINNGLTDTYVHTFAFSGTTIFAGTDMDGVFRSTNLGANWTAINQGLTNTTVWVLTASGSNLFAGTNGSGVFKRPLSEMVAVQQVSTEIPGQFSLGQNYPNPFNPTTSIKFDVSRSGNINISVYDISGRKIEDMVSGSYNPGTYEVKWDASKYSSGVYFYTLVTNEFTETKRMLMIK
ncbi:MAG TPA: T9SS type A sorting domain-containing protein [Ignavibacteria bacterium]|nr:T9SS type A sorting domain-containing protein [Ignavibacteria bacterium]